MATSVQNLADVGVEAGAMNEKGRNNSVRDTNNDSESPYDDNPVILTRLSSTFANLASPTASNLSPPHRIRMYTNKLTLLTR